jgi:replication factor C subunit 1
MNNNLLGNDLKSNHDGSKFVVLMDEVDGMSGDKGGMGALMEMIRSARVPVICIANEYS